MDSNLRINGKKIIERRTMLGLKQVQLSELSGVTHGTLRAWEHSTPYTQDADRLYRPTLRIGDIARVLGYSPRDLFYPVGPLNLSSYRYLAQKDIAEASQDLPFSTATLTRIENGHRTPNETELSALSKAYDTPLILIAAAAEETLRAATQLPALDYSYSTAPTPPEKDIDLLTTLHQLICLPWTTPEDITTVHHHLGTETDHIDALDQGTPFTELPTRTTMAYATYLHLPITSLLNRTEAQNHLILLSQTHECLKNNPLILRQKKNRN
ncbi:helix-turn-helix transcriptional regulator [Corynebacterium oculi]|uniref:Helix-turn-helix protein n=1 Tax=Corynebacterium oculi TaxID=1544416 RepID=A0A0N8VZJ6_9CORY|nr:helix-turn-helix transcriptional regulator [Corynebacterium oculi]KQB84082.1 helix-turn-helix protein [Corynebacterium oculi]